MSSDIVKKWFKSSKYAQVNGTRVRPVPHPAMKNEPLSTQKGQAECICLVADDGSKLILKKFHQGRELDPSYLAAVSDLLPRTDGFVAGNQRQILSSDKLGKVSKCYYTRDLATFLDDSILMPQVTGTDWSGLADDVRDGSVQVPPEQRRRICHELAGLIDELERNGCAHRDISSGNVHIDVVTWRVYLIDFDSLYHQSLRMPRATTCGTDGYIAAFACRGGVPDAGRTWCQHADRYALGVMIAEFCILNQGSPLTCDGGMFVQDELNARSGPGLDEARRILHAQWPIIAELFDATMRSKDFESCPSPHDWRRALDQKPCEPLELSDMESPPGDYIRKILQMRKPEVPMWSAPAISDMPKFAASHNETILPVVALPPDPWN